MTGMLPGSSALMIIPSIRCGLEPETDRQHETVVGEIHFTKIRDGGKQPFFSGIGAGHIGQIGEKALLPVANTT